MHRSTRNTLLAATALAATACNSHPAAGRYNLLEVDRKPVPETLVRENMCVVVMMRGYMDVDRDRSFISHYSIDRNCADGTHHLPDPGTAGAFTIKGSEISFTNDGGQVTGHGSFLGDTITVQGPLHELRFVRGQ